MVTLQHRSKRKSTGGRYISAHKKRIVHKGNRPSLTSLNKKSLVVKRTRGSSQKQTLLSIDKVNVYDPKTKKHKVAKIKTILETPANKNYQRRNIMTKGAVIETELGKAKITSRPGQEGQINAMLI